MGFTNVSTGCETQASYEASTQVADDITCHSLKSFSTLLLSVSSVLDNMYYTLEGISLHRSGVIELALIDLQYKNHTKRELIVDTEELVG